MVKDREYQASYDLRMIEDVGWQAVTTFLDRLAPNGKWTTSGVYDALNPQRDDKHKGSFKVVTHSRYWGDYAVGVGGKSAVGLWYYLTTGQTLPTSKNEYAEVAKKFAAWLAIPPSNQVCSYTRSSYKVNTPPPKKVVFNPDVPDHLLRKIPMYHHELGEPSNIYWYTRSYLVYRFEGTPDRKKEFRPVHWSVTEKRWVFGDPAGCLLPLYRINHLQPSQKIIFCEGEKAADAASQYFPTGLCTTTAHGSKSPYRSDFENVHGHEVIIFPDNDLAGFLYACQVAELCTKAVASQVKIVYWNCRDVPEKWDLADPLESGWPKEKLLQSVKVFNW